jgi:hypothetical protein
LDLSPTRFDFSFTVSIVFVPRSNDPVTFSPRFASNFLSWPPLAASQNDGSVCCCGDFVAPTTHEVAKELAGLLAAAQKLAGLLAAAQKLAGLLAAAQKLAGLLAATQNDAGVWLG